MFFNLQIKFSNFILLIFHDDRASFEIALKLVQFHLKSGFLPFGLLFLKVIELLEGHYFLLKRLHLDSELLNTVKELNFILRDF